VAGGIVVEGLRKQFGDFVALDGIDLIVPPVTVGGVLGPNGAGKTTAIRILTTLLAADAGRNPVTSAVDLCRSLSIGGPLAWPFERFVVSVVLITLVFTFLGVRRHRRA
jgi:ABC-type polysaccharide/polyol phosphate transport system ATPase subunit